ncbi:MAG TPA: magnesium transporter CorA family protein [Bacteroidales bacterium]|nr:magnesium transporter CorA family protein [Bacteroidales bacterium]
MPGSKFYHFSPTGLHYSVESASKAIEALKEGGFIWLNFYNPERKDLSALVDNLGVHPLSIEDCMDASQVPKIEHFPDNSFIIFNSFIYSRPSLFLDEIDLFIGKNYVITVSGINSEGREPLEGIESLVEIEAGTAVKGPAFLLHIILDQVVDRKFHAIETLEDELETAEEELIRNPEKFNPADLIRLRRDLLNMRKSLYHEREILVKICRLDSSFITDKSIFHYRDIYDHLAKFLELSETYREIVTSLMELYTSLLNNIMTNASNQTNLSVRRLTLIATIFMPLTLLASILGMSEWSMITGPENWKIAYPLFIAGMIVLAFLSYLLIRRMEKKS